MMGDKARGGNNGVNGGLWAFISVIDICYLIFFIFWNITVERLTIINYLRKEGFIFISVSHWRLKKDAKV